MHTTHPASMTTDQREQARHKPARFDRVDLADGGVVYLDSDRCSAVAYAGRAIRLAWAYRFTTATQRADYVARWVAGRCRRYTAGTSPPRPWSTGWSSP